MSLGEHGALGDGVAGDMDAAAAAEFQKALVAEQSQGAQHGVGVHPQDGREVPGGGQSLTGACLSIGNRPSDLPGDLVMEQSRVGSIYLDLEHCASYDSTNDRHSVAKHDVSLLAPDRSAAEPAQTDLLIREARRRQRRRRLAVTGLVLVVLGGGGVAIAAGTGGPSPRHAPLISRPHPLIAPGPGRGWILHIDVTTTETTAGGHTYNWEQVVYLQTSWPYVSRTIDRRLPGTPSGTEGLIGAGVGEQIYDPTNNTIYDPPVPKPAQGTRTLTPAQEAQLFAPAIAQYPRQLRAKLNSGKARMEGRTTVDGRAALKIGFAGGHETDYVAADGSYAPIETIYGRPSSASGQTMSTYHIFQYVPTAGNAALLSLIAQHPRAKVDRSLRDFRAANNRLFRNG